MPKLRATKINSSTVMSTACIQQLSTCVCALTRAYVCVKTFTSVDLMLLLSAATDERWRLSTTVHHTHTHTHQRSSTPTIIDQL